MELEINNFAAPDETADLDGYDFEVLGDEPYTSLHSHGAEEYGQTRE